MLQFTFWSKAFRAGTSKPGMHEHPLIPWRLEEFDHHFSSMMNMIDKAIALNYVSWMAAYNTMRCHSRTKIWLQCKFWWAPTAESAIKGFSAISKMGPPKSSTRSGQVFLLWQEEVTWHRPRIWRPSGVARRKSQLCKVSSKSVTKTA